MHSIYAFSSVYLGLGRSISRLSKVVHTSLSLVTSSSSDWRIARHFQAR